MTDTRVFGPLFHAQVIDFIRKLPTSRNLERDAKCLEIHLIALAFVMPCITCRRSYRKHYIENLPDRAIQETVSGARNKSLTRFDLDARYALATYKLSEQESKELIRSHNPLLLWWYSIKEMINESTGAPNLSYLSFLRRTRVWPHFAPQGAAHTIACLLAENMRHSLDDLSDSTVLCEYELRRMFYVDFFYCTSVLLEMVQDISSAAMYGRLAREYWSFLPRISHLIGDCKICDSGTHFHKSADSLEDAQFQVRRIADSVQSELCK